MTRTTTLKAAAPALAEAALLLGLFLLHLLSFGRLTGPLHGPLEAFDQDSTYILRGLAAGEIYRWNPQNHLLYHLVIESGFALWRMLFGSGLESAFRYLKLLTALVGLAFLVAMRGLFVELGLKLLPRLALIFLTGISVTVWFHASAFETHGLALPALAAYLVTLVRLRDRDARTMGDRLLFVGSLLVMGWARVDLFRFAVVSALLLLLPAVRRWWGSLAVDLGVVALLGVAGSALLASVYFKIPFHSGAPTVLERRDREWLAGHLRELGNLDLPNLGRVARATSVYSMMMPIADQPGERGFLSPPTYVMGVEWPRGEDGPSTRLFSKSLRNVLGNGLALVVAVGLVGLLAVAGAASIVRVARGDPLHGLLAAQVVAGWLLYTWFDPFEPFLWAAEYAPLWMVLVAEWLRRRTTATAIAVAGWSVGLALHNWHAFYLPFR